MKVLVLADEEQKNELLSCSVHEDLHIEWGDEDATGPYAKSDAIIDLLFENSSNRLEWLHQSGCRLIIINSVIIPLELSMQENFIRINGWNTFLKRPVAEVACRNESLKKKTENLLGYLGRSAEWVADVPGLITPRIIASIINEAFLALEEKVSTETEIDTAMKLGTNYPYGPFEWGQKIGLHKVFSLLELLSKDETRYKPSSLLKQKILV